MSLFIFSLSVLTEIIIWIGLNKHFRQWKLCFFFLFFLSNSTCCPKADIVFCLISKCYTSTSEDFGQSKDYCFVKVKKHKDENWANTLKSFSREPNSAKVVTSWEAKSCLLPGQSQVQHNSLTHCSISFCYLAKDGHPVFIGLRARDNLQHALCVFIYVCAEYVPLAQCVWFTAAYIGGCHVNSSSCCLKV